MVLRSDVFLRRVRLGKLVFCKSCKEVTLIIESFSSKVRGGVIEISACTCCWTLGGIGGTNGSCGGVAVVLSPASN